MAFSTPFAGVPANRYAPNRFLVRGRHFMADGIQAAPRNKHRPQRGSAEEKPKQKSTTRSSLTPHCDAGCWSGQKKRASCAISSALHRRSWCRFDWRIDVAFGATVGAIMACNTASFNSVYLDPVFHVRMFWASQCTISHTVTLRVI